MYKDMTMKEFNKGIDRVSKDEATHAFMQGGKKTIKIPYFFK
jgi:hypothetical protein